MTKHWNNHNSQFSYAAYVILNVILHTDKINTFQYLILMWLLTIDENHQAKMNTDAKPENKIIMHFNRKHVYLLHVSP